MLREEIERLRDALNNAIRQNRDYGVVYNISTQLDKLIVSYYKEIKLKVS